MREGRKSLEGATVFALVGLQLETTFLEHRSIGLRERHRVSEAATVLRGGVVLMRILCLHGFRQNGSVFARQCEALESCLRSRIAVIEFVYLDAPWAYKEPSEGRPRQLMWWRASDDGALYEGWQDSVQLVKDEVSRQGTVTGILGFSQGAAMTALIAAMRCRGDPVLSGECKARHAIRGVLFALAGNIDRHGVGDRTPIFLPFRDLTTPSAALRRCTWSGLQFVIMFSAFPARAEDIWNVVTGAQVVLPSAHVIAENDDLVPPRASRMVLDCFEPSNREEVVHQEGHTIPTEARTLESIARFLEGLGDKRSQL